MAYGFVGAVLAVLLGLIVLAALLSGAPLPRLRRRALKDLPQEFARIGLHLGHVTVRRGGFAPRRIGL